MDDLHVFHGFRDIENWVRNRIGQENYKYYGCSDRHTFIKAVALEVEARMKGYGVRYGMRIDEHVYDELEELSNILDNLLICK